MKIPYNISLFLKGVYVINYIRIKLKIASLLFSSREGEGEKGMFVMNMGKRSEVNSC